MDFTKEIIVFAGELLLLSTKQAKALVFSLGGNTQSTVTKRTTILVEGILTTKYKLKNDIQKEEEKVKQFEQLGHSIVILSEKEFLVLANRQLVTFIRKSY